MVLPEALKRQLSRNIYSSSSSLSSWGTIRQRCWKLVEGRLFSIFSNHLSVRTLPQERIVEASFLRNGGQ